MQLYSYDRQRRQATHMAKIRQNSAQKPAIPQNPGNSPRQNFLVFSRTKDYYGTSYQLFLCYIYYVYSGR